MVRSEILDIRIFRIQFFSLIFGAVLSGAFLLFFPLSTPGQAKLETLRQQIENGNTEAKRDALFEIRNLRAPEASRIAIPALRDNDELVRATAAGSVVFLPRNEAAQALTPLLLDGSDMVRREAAYGLGEAGDPSATAAIIGLQKDKIIEVRGAAAVALGKIGDVSGVGVLVELLETGANDDNEFLRRSAARSIGQIAQFLRSGRIENVTAQFPAFKPATAVLIKTLNSAKEADDTRREAAYALGSIGDESAIPALETGVKSLDPYLVEICKKALLQVRK